MGVWVHSAGTLSAEDAEESPVSLLQSNVTLYKTLEPGAELGVMEERPTTLRANTHAQASIIITQSCRRSMIRHFVKKNEKM